MKKIGLILLNYLKELKIHKNEFTITLFLFTVNLFYFFEEAFINKNQFL